MNVAYLTEYVVVSVDSPFKVGVWPRAGPQVVRAWGPGLQGGVVGMSADFVVESICAEEIGRAHV